MSKIFNCLQKTNKCYEKIKVKKDGLAERVNYALKSYIVKGKTYNFQAAKNYLISELRYCKEKKLCSIFLDSKNKVLASEVTPAKTIDKFTEYPLLAKRSVELKASAVLIARNYPSGKSEINSMDYTLTKQLRSLLRAVDIQLLCHVIVKRDKELSFL